jgi:glycopeptide antibiotics resistance protein
VIYEFKQYYTSGTLDFSDIIASLAGGVVSYLILVYVGKRFKNQEK